MLITRYIRHMEVGIMNEAQVKHFIVMERQKGTTIEELIFILHDNGVPEYEISNYLEISIKYVEEILSDY